MAERVGIEFSKRNGWPGGGQRGEECVARVLKLRPSAINSRSLASGDEPEWRHWSICPSDVRFLERRHMAFTPEYVETPIETLCFRNQRTNVAPH